MTPDEFRKNAHELVEWMASYMENVGQYPVKSQSRPGEIFNRLPDAPPLKSESFSSFMKDLEEIIMPGITHWQSPDFYAYFPANTSPPSILAEMITATLGAQCMNWETSPAAAELEEKMMNWLRSMTGLPDTFEGVIQDSASTATLAAILTAREKTTAFTANNEGLNTDRPLRVYCSEQGHSSIEKGVRISGIGRKNLVRIPVKEDFSMDPEALKKAVEEDKDKGYLPCCVIATLGTTGTTAFDPLRPIGEICRKNHIWLHVDAAMAGTALILPEFRWMLDGSEYIDSFLFNPHKWMFTNFDCTAFFIRDADSLIRTFEILPEYLKTRTRGRVNDYRDWGIPLGRRFRALKLWSVIRSYGVEGLQEKIRQHIAFAMRLKDLITNEEDFEILAPVIINVVCFRFVPEGCNGQQLNELNETLNHRLNDSGKIYLSHTVLNGKYTLRMVTGQTNVTLSHVEKAWDLIKQNARALL
ncbi:MAG TPA: aminotransferase class I/II-fold pyridoxal phosphate-dependent enzyme [Bacteroidales bacterium]|nr:aminotransferase class I/II-fold pyridoxal phosphate-dependent enzyme [Bacteroidales bacterium]HPJ59309.1 aminotransferase class I/II-fold pyridoxal phosphate-dependent enzyme [Bacteroidales bacterium]HPR13189.1 aminotransferase class I/II-fold pyridoxal phosphate-dependent enzyme [Bacteroidales bacterium]